MRISVALFILSFVTPASALPADLFGKYIGYSSHAVFDDAAPTDAEFVTQVEAGKIQLIWPTHRTVDTWRFTFTQDWMREGHLHLERLSLELVNPADGVIDARMDFNLAYPLSDEFSDLNIEILPGPMAFPLGSAVKDDETRKTRRRLSEMYFELSHGRALTGKTPKPTLAEIARGVDHGSVKERLIKLDSLRPYLLSGDPSARGPLQIALSSPFVEVQEKALRLLESAPEFNYGLPLLREFFEQVTTHPTRAITSAILAARKISLYARHVHEARAYFETHYKAQTLDELWKESGGELPGEAFRHFKFFGEAEGRGWSVTERIRFLNSLEHAWRDQRVPPDLAAKIQTIRNRDLENSHAFLKSLCDRALATHTENGNSI